MKIYIGMPSTGHIVPQTVASLIRLHNLFTHGGHEVAVDFSMTSVLPKMRNEMTGKAVDSGADVVLFIDSDVSFDPVPVAHLVLFGKDVSFIAYRRKENDASYTCQIESDENGRPVVKDGWVKLAYAGAGLIAIKTTAIREMSFAYPDLEYVSEEGDKRFALFDFSIHDGMYKGEDYTFCRRWRDIGGEIWMWPDADTIHHGHHEYAGNIADFLMGENHVVK